MVVEFPEMPSAIVSIKLQMRLQAKFLRSKFGKLIKALGNADPLLPFEQIFPGNLGIGQRFMFCPPG